MKMPKNVKVALERATAEAIMSHGDIVYFVNLQNMERV
jgi:hypothetical protein